MRKLLLALSVLTLPLAASAQLTDDAIIRYQNLHHPVLGALAELHRQSPSRESTFAL